MAPRARKKKRTTKQEPAQQSDKPEWLTRLIARQAVIEKLATELAELRDKLRTELSEIQDILDDVETAHDDLDNGRQHIEQAVDALSQKL